MQDIVIVYISLRLVVNLKLICQATLKKETKIPDILKLSQDMSLRNHSFLKVEERNNKISWPFQGGASFVGRFLYFMFIFDMLSCLFLEAFL